jgi:hypothetical protein
MRLRSLVIALTFLVAFASDSWGQSQGRSQQMGVKEPETAASQPIRPEDQRGTEQSPLIVKVNPTPKTDAEREAEAKERERVAHSEKQKEKSDADLVKYTAELAFFTSWLAYATLALVVATFGLGVAAFFQSRDTKASVAEAKRAADIAENSLVKLQRAFVAVQQIRHHSHLDTTKGKIWWSFHIIWENSGASPTRNLRFFVAPYLENVDIPQSFKFDMAQTERPTTFLGPKATLVSGEIHITGDDLVAVQNGTKFLYLWGRADYRDIFEKTPDHVTKFFMRVGVRGDPTKAWDQTSNIVEMILTSQNRHNCADEDCNAEA